MAVLVTVDVPAEPCWAVAAVAERVKYEVGAAAVRAPMRL
jgi:hypothetical protein